MLSATFSAAASEAAAEDQYLGFVAHMMRSGMNTGRRIADPINSTGHRSKTFRFKRDRT